MLLYVMERNNIYRRLLFMFASLLGGKDRARGLGDHIDEVLHLVDEKEIGAKLRQQRKLFGAWTEQDPFEVHKLPTLDELMRAARQRERAQRSRYGGKLKGLKDSMLPEGI